MPIGSRSPSSGSRITVRDVTDFNDHLRRKQGQAVSTVNRALVTIRRFLAWLGENGHLKANPAKPVKELRRQQLAPKGLERNEVRQLLREVELREDLRAGAIFSLFLYTGCRVSDLVALELHDLILSDRSGTAVYRFAKGNKQRSVPLPLPARQALQAYLESRPPVETSRVFVGERGPLTERGVRALCDKYSAKRRIRIVAGEPLLETSHSTAFQLFELRDGTLGMMWSEKYGRRRIAGQASGNKRFSRSRHACRS
jgi:site-specific recombinase XerD